MDGKERSRESSFMACSSSWSEFAVSGGPETRSSLQAKGGRLARPGDSPVGEGEVCVALVWPS